VNLSAQLARPAAAVLPRRFQDTFATDDARTAHINSQIPAALAKVSADLLASDPDIRPVDVLAFK
jgi:hypothetical protein